MAILPKLPTIVRGKDYIETKDWSTKAIDLALTTAGDLKKMFRKGTSHRNPPRLGTRRRQHVHA